MYIYKTHLQMRDMSIIWFRFVSQGANVAVDEVLNTFVLDYDLVNKRLDLTVDSNLVRRRKEIKSKNKKKVMNRD